MTKKVFRRKKVLFYVIEIYKIGSFIIEEIFTPTC